MKISYLERHRRQLFKIQNGICPWCSLPLPAHLAGTDIDHIIPRCRGGPSAFWNKQLLHITCNRVKGGRLTEKAAALATEHGIILRLPFRPDNR